MKYLNKEDIDFPTTPEYTKEDIRRVQAELLEMTKKVVGILEKHDIPYFMAFGTLIGAVKFGGFLPWDDDVDLFLFDETYDKAMHHLEEELPAHLIVHSEKNDPMYFLAWNSVKNLNTSVVDNDIYNPDNKLLKYKCLGVDMYRLKKVKHSNIKEYEVEEAIKFFEKKKRFNLINEQAYHKAVNKLKKQAFINDYNQKFFSNDEAYTFIVKLKNPIKPESILPLKRSRFESLELFLPNDTNAVLQACFGDFSQLPQYKYRIPHLKKVEYLK